MQTLTLSIAGTSYEIKELTLGQLEAIQEVLFTPVPANGINTKADREIIAIALSGEYPEVTAATLAKVRMGSIKTVSGIVKQVLEFGGFGVASSPPGEAVAGAA